jgi:hypothetical protein
MVVLPDVFSRAWEQLLDRSSGPMHFRLIMQPCVAAFLAIRAGIKDAREGNPVFLWTVVTSKAERELLLRSGWKDVGKVVILAIVLDAIYQFIVLHGFHILQALIVAIVVAVIPYVLLRGPVTRIMRGTVNLTPAAKH